MLLASITVQPCDPIISQFIFTIPKASSSSTVCDCEIETTHIAAETDDEIWVYFPCRRRNSHEWILPTQPLPANTLRIGLRPAVWVGQQRRVCWEVYATHRPRKFGACRKTTTYNMAQLLTNKPFRPGPSFLVENRNSHACFPRQHKPRTVKC